MTNLKESLDINSEKLNKLISIKKAFLTGQITSEEAKRQVNESIKTLTPDEFAYTEQVLKDEGFEDEHVVDEMDELLFIVKDVLKNSEFENLTPNHPINTYLREHAAFREVLKEMEELSQKKFIKNPWLEIYDKLEEFKIHLSRKQNQLYTKLEEKDFDRPSKIMWTFDNAVRDIITKGHDLLENDMDREFLDLQPEVIEKLSDILEKEESILFPTSLKLISDEEFEFMRSGDDEIGYALITPPEKYVGETHYLSNNDELKVSEGLLTLEQINLIFKNMPVDLSYVDENEIMRFYTDTVHRVFPRSKGVIGRDVKNCHPRESVETVERIIDAFRNKEQSKAEFWIQMKGKFIYILYTAIYDEAGNFKGVLEMMQDATHIRSLEGNRRILNWDDDNSTDNSTESSNKFKTDTQNITQSKTEITSKYNLDENTIIGKIIGEYPYIKDFLIGLNPTYKNLKNPLMYSAMSKVATLEMISEKGGYTVSELISLIETEIDKH